MMEEVNFYNRRVGLFELAKEAVKTEKLNVPNHVEQLSRNAFVEHVRLALAVQKPHAKTRAQHHRIDSYLLRLGAPAQKRLEQFQAEPQKMAALLANIQERNSQKPSSCKAAVILVATGGDEVGAFSETAIGHKILHLAKTHYIALKMISEGNAIGQIIAQCKKEIGRSVDLLILAGHGDATSIQFGGKASKSAYYTEERVAGNDFESLDPHATILLESCNTGKSLARKIASVSKRIVIASISAGVSEDSIFLRCCEKHGYTMVDRSENNVIISRAFHFKDEEVVETEAVCDDFELSQDFYKEQFKWYLSQARKGDSNAQYLVAACYYKGKGVQQDYKKASKWWEMAAKQGHVRALHNLSVSYTYGEGVKQNHKKAFDFCLVAASEGVVEAIRDLGLHYYKGQGVEKDEKEAFEWFEMAAVKEDALAQYCLALCYRDGKGVEKDPQEAFKWFQEAASQDHSEAQSCLGDCYAEGAGVEKDFTKAFEWYEEAAKQGSTTAKEKLQLKAAIEEHFDATQAISEIIFNHLNDD